MLHLFGELTTRRDKRIELASKRRVYEIANIGKRRCAEEARYFSCPVDNSTGLSANGYDFGGGSQKEKAGMGKVFVGTTSTRTTGASSPNNRGSRTNPLEDH
ncbi:hypothetical protein NMY22_g17781 [Coprinellus aureogranulatus]|nr:hypothetical protein NMY22_g17781 [Coprinellus aureogranulatus]